MESLQKEIFTKSKGVIFLNLTCYVEVSLVKHLVKLDSGKDLKMKEVFLFSK